MANKDDSSFSSDAFLARIRATIAACKMLAPGARVLVAVSGGPDSMCLLHALLMLDYDVVVGHFDHQTRDGASAEDAAFVRAYAETHGLPFHLESCPVEEEAARTSQSFEEYARSARYAFLFRAAQQEDCMVIATGHNAGDEVETMLMRFLRGTSPRGLGGIPPVRGGGPVPVVRPLIACTRSGIIAHLKRNGTPYLEDATNADTSYPRNKIRHELIPLLELEYNPKLGDALKRLAALQRAENDFLQTHADAFLESCLESPTRLRRPAFAGGELALQRRALAEVAVRHGAEPNFDLIDEAVRHIADGPTGAACDLGGGVSLYNNRDTTDVRAEPPERDESVVELCVPCDAEAFGCEFRLSFMEAPPGRPLPEYCNPRRQLFDADAVAALGPLTLRTRCPGDRFRPLGMAGTRKLKDYFIDLGVPKGERDAQPLLLAGGEIIWVVGRAVSVEAAVKEDTRRMLQVEVLDG